MADTTLLIEQWAARLKEFVREHNVTLSTYQGAQKHVNTEWDLMITDEAQRLPADTFSRLAFIKTKYRLGLTGTPWREDDRQYLITALSGFPVSIRWADLIEKGVLKRPRIIVATVPNEAAKTTLTQQLLSKRRGRAIIFCDWLKQGQELADKLDVPFINGATRHKLDEIQEAEVCVISRVGDRGLSLPDVRLVIEVAGAGAAREQFAQRVGRLLHGNFQGEFYTIFTQDEVERFKARIFGVEAELAGQVDIEFVGGGKVTETKRTPGSRAIRTPKPKSNGHIAEGDELAQLMALPSIAAKLDKARQGLERPLYVGRIFRLCYEAALSPKDIAEGMGNTGSSTLNRLTAACRALHNQGLLKEDDDGRYSVHAAEVLRLKALSQIARK